VHTAAQTTAQNFPPMHPVTRLGRVIQQLRSFNDLHGGELETLASQLDSAGTAELATRVRLYRDVQRDEAQMVIDELLDLQNDMAATSDPLAPATGPGSTGPGTTGPGVPVPPPPTASGRVDPAANSPRRAKWLAEQAAEAERLKQPISRRNLFNRAPPKPEDT
jgi:hypothetical protein